MNDNRQNRIFLEANNVAKEKHGVNYNELPPALQEAILNMAKRNVAEKIQREINNVGGKQI